MGRWESVGPAETRPDLSAAIVGETEVALAQAGRRLVVGVRQHCPHEECPLADGDLEEDKVICYCHGSTFDLRSGAVLQGPAEEPLTMFDVRIVDGDLQLLLEP